MLQQILYSTFLSIEIKKKKTLFNKKWLDRYRTPQIQNYHKTWKQVFKGIPINISLFQSSNTFFKSLLSQNWKGNFKFLLNSPYILLIHFYGKFQTKTLREFLLLFQSSNTFFRKGGFPKIGKGSEGCMWRNLATAAFLVQFSPMKDLLIFPGVIFCQEKICSAKVKPRTMHTVPKSPKVLRTGSSKARVYGQLKNNVKSVRKKNRLTSLWGSNVQNVLQILLKFSDAEHFGPIAIAPNWKRTSM